jgi:DNA polymerase III alpha subunit
MSNENQIKNYLQNNWKKSYEILESPEAETLFTFFQRPIPLETIYFDRLAKEIKLVIKNKFLKVFYQVHKILELAGTDIPHVTRGSAGSSLICYLMKISNFDPIEHHISLARFMHDRRRDYPDIDLDFPWHLRDQIYDKINKNWENQVARISNHIFFKEMSALKQAIRDHNYHKFLPKDFELEKIFPDPETLTSIKKRAKELLGTMRGHSLHCGGIIIFDEQVPQDLLLKEYKVFRNNKDDTTVAPQIKLNKDEVEDHGLIKIDILSNRGLGQLWETSHRPIEDYPDDPKVYQLLAEGSNLGIVYAESRAMRKIFMMMQISNLEGIAEGLALIRPAASRGNQKSDFLKNYSPLMEDRDKYIIYDDDAIHYIQRMIKVDESIADVFRKAFAKNRYPQKQQFRQRLKKYQPNLTVEETKLIMDQLERLTEYSFCKSHAYSYAQLVYALAYQKCHHPKKFWLAALNHCNSAYRRWVHFREAQTAGLNITFGRPPWRLLEDGQTIIGQPLKPKNKSLPVPLYSAKSENRDPMCDYYNFGYWIGPDFLPNMYFRQKNLTRREFYLNLGKNHNRSKKDMTETLQVASFRGLIATGRPYTADKITELGQLQKRKGRKITFLTIGYDNGKYVDVVIWGHYGMSRQTAVEGYGLVKKTNQGEVIWIEAVQFKFVDLNSKPTTTIEQKPTLSLSLKPKIQLKTPCPKIQLNAKTPMIKLPKIESKMTLKVNPTSKSTRGVKFPKPIKLEKSQVKV